MDKEKVLNLSKLARIEISEEEAVSLSKEFEGILSYVDEIKKAEGADIQIKKENFPVRNILREDTNPHKSGQYTDDIVAEAPLSENGYIKVKNIL